MAITRAQQAKQMLREGGRIGFFKGAQADASAGKGAMSPGTDTSGGFRGGNGGGGDGPKGPPSILNKPPVKVPRPKPKETTFQKFKRTFNPSPITTAILNKISNSKFARMNNAMQRQNYIDSLDLTNPEEKEEYDRIMNQLGGLGMDIIAGPTDLESTMLSVPPSMLATDPMTQFKKIDGVSTLGDPGVGDVLGQEYQDYLNRFETEDRDDRGDPFIPIIQKMDDTEEDTTPVRNLGGLSARIGGSLFNFDEFAADGGRIGAAEGGIMDLETAREAMFLGGIVKGLKKITKKATRAVKKVAKSPIGKAALLGLGAYYMPGFGIKATGGFSNFTQPGGFLSKILTKGGDKALNLDNLSGLKIAGLLTAAPFLFGQQEEEDDPDPNRGPKLTMEELLAIRGAPFNTLAPRFTGSTFAAEGGRMGYQKGSKEPVAKKVMPLLDMGGKEMDLRDNGGFVPIGRMEKADDVPARLSKNEFVFTADAVRNAGDGDVDKGSEVMYNMMKNLESGGEVSEESQGLKGAREMFQTAQRLEEVI